MVKAAQFLDAASVQANLPQIATIRDPSLPQELDVPAPIDPVRVTGEVILDPVIHPGDQMQGIDDPAETKALGARETQVDPKVLGAKEVEEVSVID